MNLSLKYYILALGVLALGTTNAELCPGDHDILSHNLETEIFLECMPGDPDTYIGVNFTNNTGNAGPYAGLYAGAWCIDIDRKIFCNQNYTVDTYSSYDDIPTDAVDKPENLDLVNWLINNHPIESAVNITDCYDGILGYEEYQEAIWTLVDDADAINLNAMDCIVDWLVQQAEDNGNNFELDCSYPEAKVGVVVVIDLDDGTITNQVLLAEIPLGEIDGVCDCGGTNGDPHFKTWSSELYDFHGICDLTLLKNPQFMNSIGMDINVRSKKVNQFSYISTAVIRIGSETFEVAGRKDGGTFWLNGKQGGVDGTLQEGTSIAGYLITFRQVHSHQREYVIHIGKNEKIVFGTWRDFVRVDMKGATRKNFHGSLGLMGSFDKKGVKLGRDGITVIDNIEQFGMEWQVLASEAMLFDKVDGPQHPTRCDIPTKTALRRRLTESLITSAEAEVACSHVKEAERDLCIFDVMATNDEDVASAY